MELSSKAANLSDILPWRVCIDSRCGVRSSTTRSTVAPGWTQEYLLFAGSTVAGYGSVAVAGPWMGKLTVYEFYVLPPHRVHAFELFRALLTASRAVMINVQSNDSLITVMQHSFGQNVTNESISFHDQLTTALSPANAVFGRATATEVAGVPGDQLQWHGVVEVDGTVAATGGILFHYNRPYGDIHMNVVERFRRRGLGSFLVQELKRICYEGGNIPAARCSPGNLASRRTLQKAGFIPCGNLLNGILR